MAWGGKREGAGRKLIGRKARSFRLTDNEYNKVKNYVENLKEEKKMAKDWTDEMEMDENLNEQEIARFIKLIVKTGTPTIEEYAESKGKDRCDIEDEYWDKYGDVIRETRDEATALDYQVK